MSLFAMTWAFAQEGLKPSEKLVLLALADFADEQHNCWPGQITLAAKASVSDRTLRRLLDDLVEMQLVTRTRRSSPSGQRTSDLYHLEIQPANMSSRPSPTGQNTPANRTSETANRPTVAGTGEPSVEPSVKESLLEMPGAWDAFWAAYPNKSYVNNAKAAFQRAIESGVDDMLLVMAAAAYAAEMHGSEPRFIKQASKWLDEGGWSAFSLAPVVPIRKALTAEERRAKAQFEMDEMDRRAEEATRAAYIARTGKIPEE